MATTCKLIAKVTLGSDAATIDFSSIPATFTDLVLLISARGTSANIERNVSFTFNGSTTNRSSRLLEGSGSSVSSATTSTLYGGPFPAANATANTFGNAEIYIPNYAGSTNKSASVTAVMENNATTSYIDVAACLWSNTAAINQVTLATDGGNFKSGSSAYLYGITKA